MLRNVTRLIISYFSRYGCSFKKDTKTCNILYGCWATCLVSVTISIVCVYPSHSVQYKYFPLLFKSYLFFMFFMIYFTCMAWIVLSWASQVITIFLLRVGVNKFLWYWEMVASKEFVHDGRVRVFNPTRNLRICSCSSISSLCFKPAQLHGDVLLYDPNSS